MVKYKELPMDDVFNAISHEVRRTILKTLLQKSATVSELAKPHTMSLPAITKHLHVLERAQLIKRKRLGRTYVLTLNSRPLLEVKKWLILYETFWVDILEKHA